MIREKMDDPWKHSKLEDPLGTTFVWMILESIVFKHVQTCVKTMSLWNKTKTRNRGDTVNKENALQTTTA